MGQPWMKHLAKDCKPEAAQDRTLPYNSYLIQYNDGSKQINDIDMSSKMADVFDYYWDRFKDPKMIWTQTQGRIQPRLWLDQQEEPKKKRKRR